MSIIALGVMPYITASIVVQLGAIALRAVEGTEERRRDGRKKLNQYTRYLTVLLTTVQGYFIASAWKAGATQGIPRWSSPACCSASRRRSAWSAAPCS
jgi:preprotein translocase subunit SecY